MVSFPPPPPPPPPGHLRSTQPSQHSVNERYVDPNHQQAQLRGRTIAANIVQNPPPPPPRSYGSSHAESLSGLTPPSALNGPTVSYSQIPAATTGTSPTLISKPQSRFLPPPPPRYDPTQQRGEISPPAPSSLPSSSRQNTNNQQSSDHPPTSYIDPLHTHYRSSPVPSDITANSSHYSVSTNHPSPNPTPPVSPWTHQMQHPQQPPPTLTSTGHPGPPHAPSLVQAPTVHRPMTISSTSSLPHPSPDQHHAHHGRAVHPLPAAPLPPPPLTSEKSLESSHGTTSIEQRMVRPAAPMPNLSPQPEMPNFVPRASHQPLQSAHTPLQRQPPQPPQARPRLDPAQMPRPPLITAPQHVDGRIPVYETRQSLQGMLPPLADTRFLVMDNLGTTNASPLLMRPSFFCVPQHRGVWHETGDVPFGVLCTPLALHSEDYIPPPRVLPDGRTEEWRDRHRVPLIQQSLDDNIGPMRCSSCQAYASPFSQDGLDCAVCGFRSRNLSLSTPYSTVEYEVDGPYKTRELPVQQVYVYAIDLTCPYALDYIPVLERAATDLHFHWARQPLSPESIVHSSESATPGQPPILPRMGVCLFSATGIVIHSFNGGIGQYAVMSDVTEHPFCPLPLQEWTVEVTTDYGYQRWIDFLTTKLSLDISYWKEQLKGGNAYGLDNFDLSPSGAALQFLADALQESGGRGTVLTWRRPNFGVGKLSHREERKAPAPGKSEDYTPYTPVQLLTKFKTPGDEEASTFYKRLGDDCAKNRVALDIVMHCDSTMGQTFLDVATLGELCRTTCGKLVWLPSSLGWHLTLQEELRRQVQSFSGYDAVFKLRCSAGIQVKSFLSNPGVVQESLLGSQELELAHISPTTTIAVELDYRVGGIPKGNKFVFLQSALLYTTVLGKRRVRVSTLALPVSPLVREVFRSIDFSATAALVMRVNAARLHQIPVEENATPPRANTRASVYHECLHVLTSYRVAIGAGATEQLLLPETLQLLPLFVMSLMKSPLLRPTLMMNPTFRPGLASQASAAPPSIMIRPSSDDRAYFHFYASQASPASAMLLVYPRLYPLNDLEPGLGDWVEAPGPESSGFVNLPNPLRPSMEVLQDDGMYLIDNGLKVFLYLGKAVPDHVKDQASAQPLVEWNPVAHRILWQLCGFSNADRGHVSEARPVHAPLLYVLPQEGNAQTLNDSMVLDLMIEDAICGEKDYEEFLIRTHNNVRNHVKAQQ